MREKIQFNEDWIFHCGDLNYDQPSDKNPIVSTSKTERMLWGPASRNYAGGFDFSNKTVDMRTEQWEEVTLPHDYIIKQTPLEHQNNALGFFKYENAWYRKKFFLNEEDAHKRLTIMFDGIATNATVYFNGCLMKHNFCGYTSFEVDISDYARFGEEENVLAVYVKNDIHEGWWYQGGGIYRHVWLNKTDPLCVDLWGVFAAPKKLTEELWRVDMETTIRNDRYCDEDVTLITYIRDETGKTVAEGMTEISVPNREIKTAKYSFEVKNPKLWDIDSPNLYMVVTEVKSGGVVCDEYSVRTGFRTYEIDAAKGLFLNGRHVKIKGMCAHQDYGLTGRAVPDNVHKYKIQMLKEMGANGYRTSHYPQTEAIMDALDELGFIVMDETRWFESTEEGKAQLEMLIKRDRNRPSVLMWSVGNEEPMHITEQGRKVCKSLVSFAKKLDNTRYVMTAVSTQPNNAVVYNDVDIIGVNYNLDKYDEIHRKYPHMPVLASECCATGSTRGWYEDDCPQKAFLSAYDKDTGDYYLGREKTWRFINSHDWIIGSYQWIGFEHRGEAQWPRICSQSGAIDMYLQRKDAFYQNQSHWIDEPMVHLLPHWNLEGREGEEIRVSAYTNCEEVELFLNGRSMGTRQIEKYGHGEWKVEYTPGKLTAEGRIGGKVVCSETKETSGKAEKLKLILENKVEYANGKDAAIVTCICTDSEGREVPDAEAFVEFYSTGQGKILGTGSDITDHLPPHIQNRKMRAGRIAVALQVGEQPGELKLFAKSQGLMPAVLKITLK